MSSLSALAMHLDAHIDSLNQILQEHTLTQASLGFHLPKVSKDDEQNIIDNGYQFLPVEKLTGAHALSFNMRAYRDLYEPDPNFSTRFVAKYPGVIVLTSAHQRVAQLVTDINRIKDEFKAEVNTKKNALEKWEYVHEQASLGGMITLQTYRHIRFIDFPVKRLYFNFSTRYKVKRFTKQEVLEKINAGRHTVPFMTDKVTWNAQLDREYIDAMRWPDIPYFQRQPIKLRPECTVMPINDDLSVQTHSAGLPFIVSNLPERITDLTAFDVSKVSGNRGKTKKRYVLMHERLGIYRQD